MNLIVAATPKEISPFVTALETCQNARTFVSGAGCLETSLNLSRFLSSADAAGISRIIHVGIAGAFQHSGIGLLDICVAKEEIFADFGVCYDGRIEDLDFPGCPANHLRLDAALLREVSLFFEKAGMRISSGPFLTVNCASGTGKRGDYLQKKHQALCENMEGFAVARVCQEFHLPCLEVRCISNFVEDRKQSNWQIDAACEKLGRSLVPYLQI
jgi:futalosine hydrolase